MRKISKNINFSPKTSNFNKKRGKILSEIRKICKKTPKIKQKIKKIKDLDRKWYYAKVWEVTESQPLYILENFNKRGWKNHHLDHIFPIFIGYKKGIPPEKVGNIKNLRFLPFKENLEKGYTITNESKNALRRINRLKK